jgi:3-deoxy-7-phosphoheptulonate synthase
MVEVHHQPDQALSDGAQSLYPQQFVQLCRQSKAIFNLLEEGATAQS